APGVVLLPGAASDALPNVFNIDTLTFANAGANLNLNNNELVTHASLAMIISWLNSNQFFSSATVGGGAAAGVIGYRSLGGGLSEARFTLFGDSDLDGIVNVADLGNLAANFGATAGASWINGDFDRNGNVNVADLG